ncbi:MAG: hypothetical protein LQ338_004121, partial [Usnochroma carphineum]
RVATLLRQSSSTADLPTTRQLTTQVQSKYTALVNHLFQLSRSFPSPLLDRHHGDYWFQEDDSIYIQTEYRTSTTSEPQYFRSSLPQHPLLTNRAEHADYFLPLGWLVENGTTTRYVCLLNISSSPMSVWLMYDYVFLDDEDEDVVELENTKMIYDGYLNGGAPETKMKTKELVEEQDMFLLYRDIADWDPKKPKAGPKPATKAGKSPCSLGPSARAVTRKPPKNLLYAITIPAQGPLPSKIIEHWY